MVMGHSVVSLGEIESENNHGNGSDNVLLEDELLELGLSVETYFIKLD